MRIRDLKLFDLEVPRFVNVPAFKDLRGEFRVLHSQEELAGTGVTATFCQDNLSVSKPKVLRGLHIQADPLQGKLVVCLQGAIFDVVVDMRSESKSLSCWWGSQLSAEEPLAVWIPPGFAHGFQVTSDEQAVVLYKVSAKYNPVAEVVVNFMDPDLAIEWPLKDPVTNDRDRLAGSYQEALSKLR